MSLQEKIEKLSDSVKTKSKQCRYWMVRTNAGAYFDLFVKNNYVALSRNDIPYKMLREAKSQYNDKPNFVIKEVKKIIKESPNIDVSAYDERSLSVAISQVYKFVYEVKRGDIVIIPSAKSDEICVGIFTEEHLADSQQINDNFIYTRKVKWVKQLAKRYFDPFFYKLFTSHHAICDISPYQEYIERCIRSQFVINDEFHYVIALTSEKIKARHLFKFGDLMLELFEDYIKSESLDFDINSIDTSINLNSPGRIDFKSNVKIGSLLMLFIPVILTGCTNADGHQENADIYNSISNFRDNHIDRINELDTLINSLQVKKIEDSFDVVSNDE